MVRTQAPIKWTSLLLVLALLLTLIPPVQKANANTGVAFTFEGYSTVMESPTQVNSDTIEIRGTFNGVTADTITYTVERIVGGDVKETATGTGVSPIIDGYSFYFPNVKIFEGLNKVTVSGFSSTGVQSNSFYVYFPNVPTIYEVKLSDGRDVPANKPVLVTTSEISLMFRAPNATNVTVQGKTAFSAGGDLFMASGIEVKEGLNTLVLTASNNSMTYTVTRDVVRLYRTNNMDIAVYDVAIEHNSGNPNKVRLDSGETVSSNLDSPERLEGKVTGKIAVPKISNTQLSNMELLLNQFQNNNWTQTGGPLTLDDKGVVEELKLTVTSATYDYVVYKFESQNNLQINASGQYRTDILFSYDNKNFNHPVTFNYRKSDTPYIREVKLVYDAKSTGNTNEYSYTSSAVFTNGMTFFQAPIWLALDVANPNAIDEIVIETRQNDVTYTGAPYLVYESDDPTAYYKSTNGELMFRIMNLPAGEQTLNIRLNAKGTTEDERYYDLTFIPTPFIQLLNIYDGQNFEEASDFPNIQGKLINFNLSNAADLDSLSVTINGTTKRYGNAADKGHFDVDATTGEFEFDDLNDSNLQLVNGPNSIVITANSNGIPITTHITVYLFPKNMPQVSQLYPLPYPLVQQGGQPVYKDVNNDFTSTGTLTYSTTAREFQAYIGVKNTDEVVISIDGRQHVRAYNNNPNLAKTDPGYFVSSDVNKLSYLGYDSQTEEFRFLLRYFDPLPQDTTTLKLPDTGTKSVTVLAVMGNTTSSQTMQITRIRVPYIVHSPKLPEEQVVNQNFVTVAIQAEGADQILLDKEPMVKGSDEIFRLDKTLKAGKNTIKFTILTGSEKQDGSFDITYAAKNEVGAQFRTTIPNSGKISVFNGALELNFPKGTMLKQPQTNTGVATQQINLFNSQKILLGIADRYDGRTVKQINRATMVQNGTGFEQVTGNQYISSMLQNLGQFGYASQLFWIDFGYFESGTGQNSTYRTVDGLHPFVTGDDVFSRYAASKWLVPTDRGTITLKYDPDIRNEAARNLSIWRFDGRDWKNLGGVVDTGKKTVSVPFAGYGYYAVMNMRYSFDDVTGHPYARNYMNTLFAKGIMQSRSNSVFGAYENITRGEFATMIVKILDLELNYDTTTQQLTFSDVPPVPMTNALWDYKYIETAARAGIVSGLAPRQFAPGAYLTREQAATIIARALNYKLGTVEKDRASLAKQFVDAGQIDYYAIPSVQAVVKDKIMSGTPNPQQPGQRNQTFSFNPKANLNRADMAIIAYNILAKLKKI